MVSLARSFAHFMSVVVVVVVVEVVVVVVVVQPLCAASWLLPLLARKARDSCGAGRGATVTREFRDVVFEDVVFDSNNYLTPY